MSFRTMRGVTFASALLLIGASALAQGTTAAGTSAAGTSAAGTSTAGTSAAGTSAAGTSAAGTSAAGTGQVDRGGSGTAAKTGAGKNNKARGGSPGTDLKSSDSDGTATRKIALEESKLRKRMAKIARLRELAKEQGNEQRLLALDKLEKKMLSGYERKVAKWKERLGDERFRKLHDRAKKGRGKKDDRGKAGDAGGDTTGTGKGRGRDKSEGRGQGKGKSGKGRKPGGDQP